MPSLVAEIGTVIEQHLKSIGVIKTVVDEHQQAFIKAKKEEAKGVEMQLCAKCNTKALILMDGCMTCTGCGDSKCN
jgi:acetyl-CoA carboxylase alpha subunit